jgi:hypothetical protein
MAERPAKKFVHGQERCSGVAAAAAQARRNGNSLLQVNADAVADAGGFEKALRGGKDEVLGIRRQERVVALEAHPVAVALEGEGIVEVDRMQDSLQLVETIGTLSQDVKEEVDLAG